MTRGQNLRVAAGMIRANVPDLRTLIGLLEDAGSRRLATELRRQMTVPEIRIDDGRPRIDPVLWAKGSVR
jgi:hypothetical protein